jgi:hypothetical protein
MEKPHGFIQDSSLVCRLQKSLYGIKQAPWVWYSRMDSFILSIMFSRCYSDPIVYILRQEYALLLLVVYIDDSIVTRSTSSIIASVKTALCDSFTMNDLGPLHYFLKIDFTQSSSGISLTHPNYVLDILSHFHMDDCKHTWTPFLYGVKLDAKCSTPLVDTTLYH